MKSLRNRDKGWVQATIGKLMLLFLFCGVIRADKFEESCFQKHRAHDIVGTETGTEFSNAAYLASSDKFFEDMRLSALRVCIDTSKQIIAGVQVGLYDSKLDKKLILPVLGTTKGMDCTSMPLEYGEEFIQSITFRTVPSKGIISLIAKTSAGTQQTFLTGFKVRRG